MISRSMVRVGVLLVAAGAVLSVSMASVQAADPAMLYVDNQPGANCSDAGAGTLAQPYCTISAAAAVVVPGQTVLITSAGYYPEHVTITRSGTPDQPITFQSATPGPYDNVRLTGPTAGLSIDGQHDVVIDGFVEMGTAATDVEVSNSTRIALAQNWAYGPGDTATLSTGVRLSAVTDSTLTGVWVSSVLGAGIVLDAATSGVSVKQASVGGYMSPRSVAAAGIDVFGSGNTIVDSHSMSDGPGIVIEPGADNNIVANNEVVGNGRDGIDNRDADGTAITSNTVADNCGAGIAISGDSSGVSVQNNVSTHTGRASLSEACDISTASSIDIGVYDGATAGTTVDYNTVNNTDTQAGLYAWGAPVTTLAAFQATSGQGAHDLNANPTDPSMPNVDSANSAAPGQQNTDITGRAPEDDPAVENTGAGPVSYTDRGCREQPQVPAAVISVFGGTGGSMSATADASASRSGWAPIALYTFSFGDGSTLTQPTPIATHTYGQPGNYQVTVQVTDTIGQTGSAATASFTWTVGTALSSTESATTVAAGHPITLSGQLTRTDTRQVLQGRILTLQFQAAGSSAWTAVATRPTDLTGKAAAAATPSSNGTYRWTYAGTAGYLATTSAGQHVSVTVSIAVKTSNSSVRYGTTTKLSATLSPHEPGVTLALQRYEGTRGWVTISSTHESTSGTATWSIKLPRGTQHLRVVKTATTRYATSYSPTTTVKIS